MAEPNFTAQAAGTLSVALVNRFPAGTTVFAVVSGRALDNNNALVLLRSDGRTPYYPANPGGTMSPINSNDIAIRLGSTGSTTTLTVPHIAGGRIYFSLNTPLRFFLNPGPALVEPAVANPSDPNIHISWGFCEFTFNTAQLYANISYVDFVSSIPIGLTLITITNTTQTVRGLKPNGLLNIANSLRAQHSRDNQPWDQLIVTTPTNPSQPLRVLSPNLARAGNPSLFSSYYAPYVSAVYTHLATNPLSIDTQSASGKITLRTTNNALTLVSPSAIQPNTPSQQKPITTHPLTFSPPTTADILSCSTGPFATGNDPLRNALIPRLAAAFNRSTLLRVSSIPAPLDQFYKEDITNHYSRAVHEQNYDGKGYAFPYDDVVPSGAGGDQSGEVHAGDPKLWTVTVG